MSRQNADEVFNLALVDSQIVAGKFRSARDPQLGAHGDNANVQRVMHYRNRW